MEGLRITSMRSGSRSYLKMAWSHRGWHVHATETSMTQTRSNVQARGFFRCDATVFAIPKCSSRLSRQRLHLACSACLPLTADGASPCQRAGPGRQAARPFEDW